MHGLIKFFKQLPQTVVLFVARVLMSINIHRSWKLFKRLKHEAFI